MERKLIQSFDGAHRFLSNFYPAKVFFEGDYYNTVEHAYQAAKFIDLDLRKAIRLAPTPGTAKKLGQINPDKLRVGWNDMRVGVMHQLVGQKFLHSELSQMLLDTHDAELVEGNTWNDKFWGKSHQTWEGENHLGIILMKVREALRRAG